MKLVKFLKCSAIGFALTLGLAHSASAAWDSSGVSVVQAQLEMESCGLLDGDRDEIYSRCLAMSHPKYHGWDHTRWNSRGTLCVQVIEEYDAAFSWRDNVYRETLGELDLTEGSCIHDAFMETLESIRTEAVTEACGPGTKLKADGTQCVAEALAVSCGAGTELSADGTQCVPGYDCFRGGFCSQAAAQNWFTAKQGNIYAGDTSVSAGCNFEIPKALAWVSGLRLGVNPVAAERMCR